MSQSTYQIEATALDRQLSDRWIPLDPAGYFLISLDRAEGRIVVQHYGIVVNGEGFAIDPTTAEPIGCSTPAPYPLQKTYRGRTAKELCVQLFEDTLSPPVTHLNHAAYLGRELVRAESALFNGTDYIQD